MQILRELKHRIFSVDDAKLPRKILKCLEEAKQTIWTISVNPKYCELPTGRFENSLDAEYTDQNGEVRKINFNDCHKQGLPEWFGHHLKIPNTPVVKHANRRKSLLQVILPCFLLLGLVMYLVECLPHVSQLGVNGLCLLRHLQACQMYFFRGYEDPLKLGSSARFNEPDIFQTIVSLIKISSISSG